MTATWDRAARVYARQEHLEHRALTRALDLAAPASADRFLDVATGTGLVLRLLAARPGRPEVAEGVDTSPGMLARVGPLPGGWTVREADARALPQADGSADVVLAAYLLQVLGAEDRRAVLAELRRVLAPGGRLVVVTTWSARWPVRATFAGLAAAAPQSLIGLTPHDPRAELAAGGLTPRRALAVRGGYPSLVVCSSPA